MPHRRRRSPTHRAAAKTGLPPGSLVYLGEATDVPIAVDAFQYDGDTLQEAQITTVEELDTLRAQGGVTWVDVHGLHDIQRLKRLTDVFGVHPLAVEDALNPGTRAKVEDFGQVLFCVAKQLTSTPTGFEVQQVALVLSPAGVLTLQERGDDAFGAVRKRLRAHAGRVRGRGADYLLHALLDGIIDGYFTVLEPIEDRLDTLEVDSADMDLEDLALAIDALRKELTRMRRLVRPLRDAMAELQRSEGRLVQPATLPYFRDLSDHLVQTLDQIDHHRDRLTSLLELHLALTSHRMNDVMRGLTIVATLFMPITFIAGVYGMNFQHMPELAWPYAYPTVVGIMVAITAIMVAWLRSQDWI